MHKFQHAIVVGGTGMLRMASIDIAAASKQMTSVARTETSLRRLDAMLPGNAGIHHQLRLDWTAPEDFMKRVAEHVSITASPDLVVAWLHDDNLALQLAGRLPKCDVSVYFFHVIGSASNNPSLVADALMNEFTGQAYLHYHQVILGAHGSGRMSRWLTHHEISQGVIKAIKLKHARYVVGSLDHYQS